MPSSNLLPVLSANIPVVIAWFEEMQAIVTVWAGVLSEKPAPKAAYGQHKIMIKKPHQLDLAVRAS